MPPPDSGGSEEALSSTPVRAPLPLPLLGDALGATSDMAARSAAAESALPAAVAPIDIESVTVCAAPLLALLAASTVSGVTSERADAAVGVGTGAPGVGGMAGLVGGVSRRRGRTADSAAWLLAILRWLRLLPGRAGAPRKDGRVRRRWERRGAIDGDVRSLVGEVDVSEVAVIDERSADMLDDVVSLLLALRGRSGGVTTRAGRPIGMAAGKGAERPSRADRCARIGAPTERCRVLPAASRSDRVCRLRRVEASPLRPPDVASASAAAD